jgi:4-hydroxybenzoate polyprenyltransferase
LAQLALRDQFTGLIMLTRWKEYVPFVIPATILGALLAVSPNQTDLDWRLIAVTFANILAVAYAFMINDIEDAPDDARDPARAARNPITSGKLGLRVGYAACRVIAAVTLIFYALGGLEVFIIGVATLLLSHLYSWRRVRLKAWPVTDILSHSLMLSGLLLLAGYFIYHNQPGIVWFIAAGASLISAYGQLYNQLRDYDMDKAAGLKNTAILIGERNTRRAMYLAIVLAVICFIVAVVRGAFPAWLAIPLAIAIVLSAMIRPKTDMRGGEFAEASGAIQVQFALSINVIAAIWLAERVVTQLT